MIFAKDNITPGQTPIIAFRYLRLNYFTVAKLASGPTIMVRPNILLLNIPGIGWVKLLEGSVLDVGRTIEAAISFDWFDNHFSGQTDRNPTFEVEYSLTPLADLRSERNWFIDGKQETVADGAVLTVSTPPNVAAVGKFGLVPRPVLRRFALNNFSGGALLLGNRTGALISEIKNNTRFAEDMRGQVMIANASGGPLTFYYEFFFEWL